MADTPNYNESTVAGTSWTRCMTVAIDNYYGNAPSMVLYEEKIYVLEDGKVIRQPAGNLSTAFNPSLSAHLQIYELINAEYVRLRDLRDNPPPPVEVIIPPPVFDPLPDPGTP